MLKWYRQPTYIDSMTENLNTIFTAIFVSEAVVRIFGIGPVAYFKEGWNIFDFLVALGSVAGIIIT